MNSDIAIAQAATLEPIQDIAKKIGLTDQDIELYGWNKCKIKDGIRKQFENRQDGKLVLVTAMHPTPAGEGKTTTSVGLADGLAKLGTNVIAALREPSLGPVFGMKGGAAGGGYAQVVPMEDLNLHFTGDLHAITAANNLLSAMIDNHMYQGNALQLDCDQILWRRALDVNDRQLRNIDCGLGAKSGVPRRGGFDITAASEIMAIFCLADSLSDLKARINAILIGFNVQGEPVYAEQIGATGALVALLKDALKPNLVQTLEGTPTLIHGGPFANIAHGCSSVMATKIALKVADVVVTEAGFGADLGGEKFMDIKCPMANIWPDAVVIVATVRALKYHGGVKTANLDKENMEALNAGLQNLMRHIDNFQNYFGTNVVVALNQFASDTDTEMQTVIRACEEKGAKAAICSAWANGGDGAIDLANVVLEQVKAPSNAPKTVYNMDDSIETKLEKLVGYYGGNKLELLPEEKEKIKALNKIGLGKLPICVAKTQYSFSDNPKAIGCPSDFTITVRDFSISSGAGFLVALTGNVLRMPGLPKEPAALQIDVRGDGTITGLF
jgi:formate--tetrahydrofolate ligase